MEHIKTPICQSYKLLNNQPEQKNADFHECKYALPQNKHDSTLIEPSKQQKDIQLFQKKDDMSFSDRAELSNGRSSFINIHEATPGKFLYDQKDFEALTLKITSLESSTEIQLKGGMNGNHIVVLKKGDILSEDQTIKRDLWKRRLSYQKRSHRRSSNVNCPRLIYMIGFLAIAARNIHGADTVTWEVKTSPIVFGRTLELTCNISSSKNICNEYWRTWYGSKSDVLLCQNGVCRHTEKHTERKNTNCSYSLLINDVSLDDIDAYYTCSYGVSESKKELRSEDHDIIKIPDRTDMHTSFQQSNKAKILVQMNDVYPKPLCRLTFHNNTITGDINATSIQDSKYKKLQVLIIYHVNYEYCGSSLELQCLIGKETIIIKEQQLSSCNSSTNDTLKTMDAHDSTSDNYMVIAAIVSVAVIIITVQATVVFVICCCIKKSGSKEIYRTENEELRSFCKNKNKMEASESDDYTKASYTKRNNAKTI